MHFTKSVKMRKKDYHFDEGISFRLLPPSALSSSESDTKFSLRRDTCDLFEQQENDISKCLNE